jgi:sugar lactone lactonase YvrE
MATESVIDIVHRAADGVGESLRWIEEDHALLWVDITGQAIKRLEVRTGRYEEWPTPGFPAAIVPRQRSGAVVAIGRRVTLFNFGDRFDTLVVPEPNHPENRLNEAAADPLGRLWVGTMQNNIAPDGTPKSIEGRKGSLYRIEASGECRRACGDAFAITNTLVWRDRVMITADTLAGELYAYDYTAPQVISATGGFLQPNRAIPTGRVSMLKDTFGTRGLAIVACFVSTRRANSIASCGCLFAIQRAVVSAATGCGLCSWPPRALASNLIIWPDIPMRAHCSRSTRG